MITRMFSTNNWFIFGDSHVGTFKYAADHGLIHEPCLFKVVNGATAAGMRNPNSLTNALLQFADVLLPPAAQVTPVMHLGEVDCGFVIWWRAQRYGESVERQLREAIVSQMTFVEKLLLAGYPQVVLTGATLPTIRDGQDWGEIANLRREVYATLAERTALTLEFNANLRSEAASRGQPFIDISRHLLDNNTGLIMERFRHPDPADHHLNPVVAAPLWADELNAIRPGSDRSQADFGQISTKE
jgi:hypothetical protein